MKEKTKMPGVSAPDISQQKLNTRHLEIPHLYHDVNDECSRGPEECWGCKVTKCKTRKRRVA
jgi:hypothetical protein